MMASSCFCFVVGIPVGGFFSGLESVMTGRGLSLAVLIIFGRKKRALRFSCGRISTAWCFHHLSHFRTDFSSENNSAIRKKNELNQVAVLSMSRDYDDIVHKYYSLAKGSRQTAAVRISLLVSI